MLQRILVDVARRYLAADNTYGCNRRDDSEFRRKVIGVVNQSNMDIVTDIHHCTIVDYAKFGNREVEVNYLDFPFQKISDRISYVSDYDRGVRQVSQ